MIETSEQFEALFHDTRAPLLAYLDRRVAPEDAADLLADLYLVAWRKRADLPAANEQRLWLFGVARRLVAEHRRVSVSRVEVPHEVDVLIDTAGRSDRREVAVRQALELLSEVDRELITLTTWERLTTAEAARVLGITAGTARVRLHRARVRLARHPRLQAVLGTAERDRDDGAAEVAVPAASAR